MDTAHGPLVPVQRPADPIDAGVRIGYGHPRIADIDRVRDFYIDVLGLDGIAEARDVPGWGTAGDVMFLSPGGYHHLGLNTWKARDGASSFVDPDGNSLELRWDTHAAGWPRTPEDYEATMGFGEPFDFGALRDDLSLA